jgi:hypothetical protein
MSDVLDKTALREFLTEKMVNADNELFTRAVH